MKPWPCCFGQDSRGDGIRGKNMEKDFFGVLRFQGPDAMEFLHNQFSNDLKNLKAPGACLASYNTPQGRVIANFVMFKRSTEDFVMIIPSSLLEKVKRKLTMFKLRSKVDIVEAGGDFQVFLGVSQKLSEEAQKACKAKRGESLKNLEAWKGGDDAGAAKDPRTSDGAKTNLDLFAMDKLPADCMAAALVTGSIVAIAPKDASIGDVLRGEGVEEGFDAWLLNETRGGEGWVIDLTSEKHVAQMMNLDELGGVNFRKGCYPGQEVIARARYRGKVKRSPALYELALKDGMEPEWGSPLVDANGDEVGEILMSAKDEKAKKLCLLGVVKHAKADAPILFEGEEAKPAWTFFETQE